MRVREDPRVRLCKAFRGIHHQQSHITPPNGFLSPMQGETIQPFVHLGPASNPRRVNKQIRLLPIVNQGIHRIACGPRGRRDKGSVLSHQFIKQGTLAYIGPPDDGNAGHLTIDRLLDRRWKEIDNNVEQVAGSRPVRGGDGEQPIEPKFVKRECQIQP